MLFYTLIWFFLLLCSTVRNKYITIFNVFILTLIAGFRAYEIGTDTNSYLEIYLVLEEGLSSYIEPGWQFLNKIIIYSGGNFTMFLWLISLLTLYPLVYFFFKISPNPNFSLFIYYSLYAYCNSFNGMRQFLAISILFIAYMYFNQQRNKLFYLFLFIATSIHFSAIIGIAIIFLKKRYLTANKIYLWLTITLIGGILFNQTIFSILLGPYSHYLNSEFGFRDDFKGAFILTFIINLIFILLYNTSKIEYRKNFWVKLYFLGLLLMNLTFQLKLGTRIILYFTLLQTIIYPLYIIKSRIKEKQFVVFVIIIYLLFVFIKILVLGNLPNNPGSIIPYKTIFSS